MRSELEEAVGGWPRAECSGDLTCAATVVGESIVVLEPKGGEWILLRKSAGWVERSGIRPVPRSWHPAGERVIVVEEDATSPDHQTQTRVATVFRVADARVTAALRMPDLRSALDLARMCRERAAFK